MIIHTPKGSFYIHKNGSRRCNILTEITHDDRVYIVEHLAQFIPEEQKDLEDK